MSNVPPFLLELIRLTRLGHAQWALIQPGEYKLLSSAGSDADVAIRSRTPDGPGPVTITITSEHAPPSETVSDTKHDQFSQAMHDLFAAVVASTGGETPTSARPTD